MEITKVKFYIFEDLYNEFIEQNDPYTEFYKIYDFTKDSRRISLDPFHKQMLKLYAWTNINGNAFITDYKAINTSPKMCLSFTLHLDYDPAHYALLMDKVPNLDFVNKC